MEQILFIHKKMIEKYGGCEGIRDSNLLESAVVRPRMSVFGEDAYPTLSLKAAVLLHSIVMNHPFLDGNKRAGFGAIHMMLLMNNSDLTCSTAQGTEMTLKVVTERMTVEEIADWIEKNSIEHDAIKETHTK